jgi:diguanylate cyclase (GGDEF)-like protein
MKLRLSARIALTFSLLLVAVLVAAFVAVSAANRANANREVDRQIGIGIRVFERALESNRRQLSQAAQVLAADYGFREAVATHDADTQTSALENHGARIGSTVGVLVSPDGTVLASTTPIARVGERFTQATLPALANEPVSAVVTAGRRVYQLVVVPVRSPLLVAWVAMGFQLDGEAVAELASVTGLQVTLLAGNGSVAATTLDMASLAAVMAHTDDWVTREVPLGTSGARALLSRSLAEALAPFEQLSRVLVLIAAVALAVSALAVLGLARHIARPLQSLARVIDRIRSGDYHAPVPVSRADEIGAVADGLRAMQGAVDARDRAIRELAYTDALTGLRNRTAFTSGVDGLIAERRGCVAVALVNVDRFRRINECLGYAAGDAVLRAWADRLRSGGCSDVPPARLTADHYGVARIVPDEAAARAWAAELLGVLTAAVVVDGQPIDVRGTVGVALPQGDASNADLLLRCADAAVERARRAKRDVAVYEGSLEDAHRAQLSLWGELQRAVERDELRLYLQPKCRLDDEVPVGAEVLIRWQHPERGLLGPAEFVPFAEQTGLIRSLTQWTLQRSVELAARLARDGWRLPLSVNVSAVDLDDARLPARVHQCLERAGLAPALLKLEITESGFIDDPAHALEVLDALAALGVGLSIDDFGTGYSSLSYLARMPVSELKIDRSFVVALRQQETAAVVRSAIELADRLQMQTVAEGIEDATTAERLREMGCEIGQGYHYSKPLPVAEFERWLAARAPRAETAEAARVELPASA